jgi:hypothetical protein
MVRACIGTLKAELKFVGRVLRGFEQGKSATLL